MLKALKFIGGLFGTVLPYIGFRTFYVGINGELVEDPKESAFSMDMLVVEWLWKGFGVGVTKNIKPK